MTTPKHLTPKAVGQRIKAAREKRHLTAATVIEISGISKTVYYGLERGARTPRWDHLVRIHRALRTNPGEIAAF